MTDRAPPSSWDRAVTALTLLAIDPAGLGGLTLRARSSPVRDLFLRHAACLPGPRVKIPAAIADDQLFGGIDITATLTEGQLIRNTGLLANAATLILPTAERFRPDLAARLAQVLDAKPRGLLALDEGIDDERLPPVLRERAAFEVSLDGLSTAECKAAPADSGAIEAAIVRLPDITVTDIQRTQVTVLAARLGINTLRAPQFTLRAARAHAALKARMEINDDDLITAVDLTLAHRATQMPTEPEDDAPQPDDAPDEKDTEQQPSEGEMIPEDILLDAIRANLPPGLLEGQAQRASRSAAGSGAGSKRRGNRKGRPLPSRRGRLDGMSRIDLIATLRTAAPWQTIRRNMSPIARPIHIWPSDIHLRRYEEQSDRLLIFTVDASGSAALARLAEAKGAVELLLAEAYARRDHVALIAFRGDGAEELLPPTRSLVQTKRRLAALPGGGGTPLAAGLQSAADLARTSRARGMTPVIALLTDGRANIALDGSADRATAATDAETLAKHIRAEGIDAIVIDMGNRPERSLKALAGHLDAAYVPLPRANAERLSATVSTVLDG